LCLAKNNLLINNARFIQNFPIRPQNFPFLSFFFLEFVQGHAQKLTYWCSRGQSTEYFKKHLYPWHCTPAGRQWKQAPTFHAHSFAANTAACHLQRRRQNRTAPRPQPPARMSRTRCCTGHHGLNAHAGGQNWVIAIEKKINYQLHYQLLLILSSWHYQLK